MICEKIVFPDGVTGYVCKRGSRRPAAPCEVCGNRPHAKLCDGSPPKGARRKTCDRKLCEECAAHVKGADLDFCPDHARDRQRDLALGDQG